MAPVREHAPRFQYRVIEFAVGRHPEPFLQIGFAAFRKPAEMNSPEWQRGKVMNFQRGNLKRETFQHAAFRFGKLPESRKRMAQGGGSVRPDFNAFRRDVRKILLRFQRCGLRVKSNGSFAVPIAADAFRGDFRGGGVKSSAQNEAGAVRNAEHSVAQREFPNRRYG